MARAPATRDNRHHVYPCRFRVFANMSERTTPVIAIYGIKACDTMKKARAWLDEHAVSYRFHDYKSEGLTRECLQAWVRQLGWERLLNRAGTTFRKLPEADKAPLDEQKAVALMLAQPSMVKRPVLDAGGELLVGFQPEAYDRLFSALCSRPADQPGGHPAGRLEGR